MTQYLIKIVVTSVVVVLVSELSKRSAIAGATLASIPMVSVLAMIWLYVDTNDVTQVTSLARSIVWLVIPSLLLFIVLPAMLVRGFTFYLSLGVSIAATASAYALTIMFVRRISLIKGL